MYVEMNAIRVGLGLPDHAARALGYYSLLRSLGLFKKDTGTHGRRS